MAGRAEAVKKIKEVVLGRGGSKKTYTEKDYRKMKAELRREANKANKKLKAMERNGMEGLPAYQEMRDLNNNGRKRYSTAGKFNKEGIQNMEKELAKIRRFNNAETGGVVKGRNYLKKTAEAFGIKYKNTKELIVNSRIFWEVVSKLEQKFSDMKVPDSDVAIKEVREYLDKNPDAIDSQDPEAIMEAVMNRDTNQDSKNTTHKNSEFSRRER